MCKCACANVLASMCVTHEWRPAGWRAAGHMPLYTRVHMYCACGCRSTCVCSVCMYSDGGLSGNREILCPAPKLQSPRLCLQLRLAGVQSFCPLGGEGWGLGFMGNLFIPAIR